MPVLRRLPRPSLLPMSLWGVPPRLCRPRQELGLRLLLLLMRTVAVVGVAVVVVPAVPLVVGDCLPLTRIPRTTPSSVLLTCFLGFARPISGAAVPRLRSCRPVSFIVTEPPSLCILSVPRPLLLGDLGPTLPALPLLLLLLLLRLCRLVVLVLLSYLRRRTILLVTTICCCPAMTMVMVMVVLMVMVLATLLRAFFLALGLAPLPVPPFVVSAWRT